MKFQLRLPQFTVINRRQSIFMPIPHRVFVSTKQVCNFFHGIVAMDFDVAVVGVALAHNGYRLDISRDTVEALKMIDAKILTPI
jgi:hypothetical protein